MGSSKEGSSLGLWRIKNYDENGLPEEVTLTKQIKRRLKYVRWQFKQDLFCYVFIDNTTGEVYMQEAPEQPE